jgi:ribosomal RNA assembly protein
MEKLLIEKLARITKNRDRLQKALNVKINNRGKEVFIEGNAEDEYTAVKVIEALEFGFPFTAALSIKEEDFLFEILNIKSYTKSNDLERVRARIIGRDGKTLRTITNLSKCFMELNGNQIGIIGDPEHIRSAQEGVMTLIRGSKQGNVYSYLEKHQAQPVIDLGLKEPKKKMK